MPTGDGKPYFATCRSGESGIKVALINPNVEDMEDGDTALTVVLQEGGAIGLIKDLVDLLAEIKDIPNFHSPPVQE